MPDTHVAGAMIADTHAVRQHGTEIDFGNLTDLSGHWQGANGVNLIAVPDQKGGFTLLLAPYIETLTVSKIPATTPNRGLQKIENIPTLQYSTTISELNNARPGALMHVECGFWELSDPSLNAGFDIFRLASVPHGNAVEMMGKSSVAPGAPQIDVGTSALPFTSPNTDRLPLGYTDPYLNQKAVPGYSTSHPNQYLVDHLTKQQQAGLKVVETVTLQVSTGNAGGLENIASLRSNANPTRVDATFWIETLQAPDGQRFRQLQYTQTVQIEFPIRGDKPGHTIVWPHVSVNTLSLVG
jgi:hypothetical protein